jgi:hypothetical protein
MNKADKKQQVQHYLRAMHHWLPDHPMAPPDDQMDGNVLLHVHACLGRKSSEKERLVRMFIAWLACDYHSMKKLRVLVSDKKLIYRIEQLDIFSGDFRKQAEMLLMAIGQLTSRENNVEIQHPVFCKSA